MQGTKLDAALAVFRPLDPALAIQLREWCCRSDMIFLIFTYVPSFVDYDSIMDYDHM